MQTREMMFHFKPNWNYILKWQKKILFVNGKKKSYESKNLFMTYYFTTGRYSFRQWIWTVCHFMKQKCYFQRGMSECRHAATPLSSYSINTTHQGFQKRYITLFYLKGLKSYQPSKFKCLHFTPLSLVNRTFHLHFCW